MQSQKIPHNNMDEQLDLKELIREEIRQYRADRGYFGGSGLDDRDQTNLVLRLTETIVDRLEDIDRTQVSRLRSQVDDLEQELEMAKGPGYEALRQEYSAARALAKHLIYRLGKEDSKVTLTVEELNEMEQRVEMNMEEEDGVITIRVEEFD